MEGEKNILLGILTFMADMSYAMFWEKGKVKERMHSTNEKARRITK